MSPFADRKITGASKPRERISRQVVKPSILGIITSMMTRSGFSRSIAAKASKPFSA